MRFENPAALWGLGSLILLILFSLWRQASARVTVPSLLLWKRIPERNPPVRALRRPRWRLELLLQALAIAAAVGALAKPSRETSEFQPRRIALLFDTSARMRAGDRLAAMKAAAQSIQDRLRSDEVTCYDAAPAPRRIAGPAEATQIDAHVDLGPLIDGAAKDADHVVVFSDREVAGAKLALFGAPRDNAGIVEFSISDAEAFVRIVDHGGPRPLPVELQAGDLKFRGTIPAGQRTWSHKADYSRAPWVRVSLIVKDSFDLDNVVEATRLVPGGGIVALAGRHHDALPRVFKSIPGVTVQRGGSGALVSVGYDAAPDPGGLRVFIHSSKGPLSGEVAIAPHPLTSDLERRGGEMRLGELPPEARGGQVLISVAGKPALTLRGREVHVCVDLNAWQAGMPSFPIFWMNVVEFAHQAAPGLVVVRSGQPVQLSDRSEPFLAWTVGTHRLSATGDKSLYVNLLDERESNTAGETRPLGWDPGSPATKVPARKELGTLLAWVALGCLLSAWLLQVRPE